MGIAPIESHWPPLSIDVIFVKTRSVNTSLRIKNRSVNICNLIFSKNSSTKNDVGNSVNVGG